MSEKIEDEFEKEVRKIVKKTGWGIEYVRNYLRQVWRS